VVVEVVADRQSRSMRTNLIQKTIPVGLAMALALLAGACGGSGGDNVSVSRNGQAFTDPAESDYCVTAREWAIHEFDGFDDSDPVAFRAYWEEYVAFETTATEQAPDEIRADWELKVELQSATITPVLERYDFDVAAMMESATPEEQATFEAPPEVQAAQERILAYESMVCGAQPPLAADISYAGEEPGPYCELAAAQGERAAEALASGDPAEVEAVVDEIEATATALIDAAPEVIKDDLIDLAAWDAGPQRDALERHGWDARALVREGTPEDRAAFQHSAEDIRDQFARVVAYEEQVCGA
jgi:hypothetical protein